MDFILTSLTMEWGVRGAGVSATGVGVLVAEGPPVEGPARRRVDRVAPVADVRYGEIGLPHADERLRRGSELLLGEVSPLGRRAARGQAGAAEHEQRPSAGARTVRSDEHCSSP